MMRSNLAVLSYADGHWHVNYELKINMRDKKCLNFRQVTNTLGNGVFLLDKCKECYPWQTFSLHIKTSN